MNWRNRPKFIDFCPKEIDYIMFIDESGDSNLKGIKKKIDKEEEIKEGDRFFTITGCVINKNDLKNIAEVFIEIKNKYWKNGKYLYSNKKGQDKALKKVCFHSSEIRGRKSPFSKDDIEYDEFIMDLSKLMAGLSITIFSATIDKEQHCRKYLNPHNPYHLCLDFILERFVKHFLGKEEKGCLILEARGKREDKIILDHIKNRIDNGTYFVPRTYFNKIKGAYFNEKWSKLDNCQKSYFGLECADLICYPINKYCRRGEKDLAFKAIEEKIYRYPTYFGQGVKKFP